jgi:hypothetical protein
MARFSLPPCFACLLALTFGCGGSPAGNSDAGVDAGATDSCGGASSSVLEGSCTITVVGLSSCFEDYYSHALTSSEVDVMRQACGSGFSTSPCSTTNVACKCLDTSGTFKRVKYGYGTYAEACGSCTGACYSKQ